MRKAVIYTTTVSAVVLTITILCWKFWPSSSSEILPPGPGGEVIEETVVVSILSGSNLLKGSSGTFFILGLLALAAFYIQKKRASTATPPTAPATTTTPPPLLPTRNMPMHFLPTTPHSAYNPSFLRAIEMEDYPSTAPPASTVPAHPLTREQLGAVLAAVSPSPSSAPTS